MVKTFRHAGIVVTDMDKSLEFYSKILGLKVVLDVIREGDFFDKLMAHKGVRMRHVMLEAADRTRIELFQFLSHPRKAVGTEDITSIGCSHVGFAVDDVDKAFSRLTDRGFGVNCPPILSPDGYGKVLYAHGPDGTIVELVQIMEPGSSPYTKDR